MKKFRESNFELMRIVSMIFIILWHIIGRGLLIENCGNYASSIVLRILKYIIIVHVNSYIILMGYFQYSNKFKLSKLISLVFQTVFYSFIIFLILYKMGYIADINLTMFINVFIPFSSAEYWFISSYIVVYILSDYINILLKRLNHNQLKKIVIVCFIVFSVIPFITGMRLIENNGYNFFNFIFLYIIGVYLRRYPLKNSHVFAKTSIRFYRLIMVIGFLLCASYNYFLFNFALNNLYIGNIFNYISSVLIMSQDSYAAPIVIIQTICYFEFFKTLNIKSKIINLISGCVFGIYLFHENIYLRDFLYKLFGFGKSVFYGRRIYLQILICLIIIFVAGLLIEIIRKLLVKFISSMKFYKKMKIKFYNYIKSFNE